MSHLIKLAALVAALYFGYQHWFAPYPLETYRLTSVPVSLKLLPDPKVLHKQNTQVEFESLNTQKNADDKLTMFVMSFKSSMERFEPEDLEFLPYEMDKYTAMAGPEVAAILEELILSKGYINTNGMRGYEVEMRLPKDDTRMLQHIYIIDDHLLLLMASYQSSREEQTARNFLDSVQRL
ncbi:hypothetical protein [Shewanella halotolerans]|uniref:hypothetical protein n=1 Tax=Shewanella halotolerans TaxID=2864204 RepID=UPI001C661C76|nr:hypothetical protein [Shewanella halotolerans]QYJ90472.1 hypothetical protein K0H81_02390 [Shewanella halotolerans]